MLGEEGQRSPTDGYLVAEVRDCTYRGIDRMPDLDPQEFIQLSADFGLASEEWLSSTEAEGREFQAATARVLPGRTLELIFVRAVDSDPGQFAPVAGDGVEFLGLDVAAAWSPYESVLNHRSYYASDTPIPVNENGLMDSFELAERVRQQSHERLHTDWESANLAVWEIWRVEDGLSPSPAKSGQGAGG